MYFAVGESSGAAGAAAEGMTPTGATEGIAPTERTTPPGGVRFGINDCSKLCIDIYLTTFAEEFKESTNRGRSRTNLAER
jgi:hypothetical protein